MRVISGSAKGRKLIPVPGTGTRPITDRVKEAVFNILRVGLVDATFLDLFAGTGSVGIEALSRGAASAVFVDKSRKAIGTVRKNLAVTGLAEEARVVQMDAFRFLEQVDSSTAYDYIYVAPPQYHELWAKTLLALDQKPLLSEDGMIIVQIHPKEFHDVALTRLALLGERRYGSTAIIFYGLASPTGAGRED